MSIINKVIADLEERQILGSNNAGRVFAGLSAAENRSRRYSASLGQFFIVLLFFVASISATYALMGSRESAIVAEKEIAPIPEKSLHLLNTPGLENTVKRETYAISNSLKLDFSLPEVYAAESVQTPDRITVKDIQLKQTGKLVQFQLTLSAQANYRAYSLTSPDRVVIHIDKAEFSSTLPDVTAVKSLRNIRLVDRDKDELMLVIDTGTFQKINEIELAPLGESYQLAFSLKSDLPTPELNIAEPQAIESITVNNNEYESAQFGEMTKQHSQMQAFQNIESSYKKARQLYQQQKNANANRLLFGLLQKNPDYVPARSLLARKLIEQGQLQKAEALLKRGLELKESQADWANLFARLLINRGQIDDAINILEIAAPLIGTDPGYYAFLAALYQKSDNHAEAVLTYRQVIEQESNNSVWWMGLAISLESLGENAEALFAYRRALQGKSMSPDLQQYVHGKISYLSKQG